MIHPKYFVTIDGVEIASLPTRSDAALVAEALGAVQMEIMGSYIPAGSVPASDAGYHACLTRLKGAEFADAFRRERMAR